MKYAILTILIIAVVIISTDVYAGQGKNAKHKKGILLVAFGTSSTTAKVSFENIERLTRKRFKNIEIRWAFTSEIIRRKLSRQGIAIDSPTVALSKMRDDGFTHVAVQSLHTIGGAEYDEVKEVVAKLSTDPEAFNQITLGAPLLSSYKELKRTSTLLLSTVPSSRNKTDAVVLMGHGSAHHYSDLAYVAMQEVLGTLDPLAYIGTVEGHPTLDDIREACKAAGVKKAYLIPFMSVAGDHAKNDMASDDDESWKSILQKDGIECVPILKGTAEFDSIANIWIDHLEIAFKALRK